MKLLSKVAVSIRWRNLVCYSRCLCVSSYWNQAFGHALIKLDHSTHSTLFESINISKIVVFLVVFSMLLRVGFSWVFSCVFLSLLVRPIFSQLLGRWGWVNALMELVIEIWCDWQSPFFWLGLCIIFPLISCWCQVLHFVTIYQNWTLLQIVYARIRRRTVLMWASWLPGFLFHNTNYIVHKIFRRSKIC